MPGVGRGLLPAGSFCGGAGGASGPEGGVGAPRGPRGSSTASSLVGWTPYCLLRGPRPAGERGAAETLGTVLADGFGEERGSRSCQLDATGGRQAPVPDSSSWAILGTLWAGLDREGTSAHNVSTGRTRRAAW